MDISGMFKKLSSLYCYVQSLYFILVSP